MLILMTPILSMFILLVIVKLYLKQTIKLTFFSWGFLHDFLVIIVLYGIVLWINIKWLTISFSVVFILFYGILSVVDSVYYRYFDTLTSKRNFQGLTFFKKAEDSLGKEYDIKVPWHGYIIFLITGVLIVLLFVVNAYLRIDYFYVVFFALFIQLFYLMSLFKPKSSESLNYYLSNKYLFLAMPNRLEFVKRYGYMFYHLLDLLRPKPLLNKDKVKEQLDNYFKQIEKKEFNDKRDYLKGSNVILITAESFDTRLVQPKLTPNLYHLLNDGLSLNNYYIPVFQQGATSNSEFMALTGLYALNTNAYGNNVFHAFQNNHFPYALPNQLKEKGYSTYYFHSGHEWFYQRQKVMPLFGFEIVKFQEDLKRDGYKDFSDKFDSKMITFFDEYVDMSKPFYAQLLTYSMHGAYNQTMYEHHNDQVNLVYKTGISDEARVYLQKLVEFDHLIGNIIKKLEEAQVKENTLIVITADHYPYMLTKQDLKTLLKVDLDHEDLHKQTLIMYHKKFKGMKLDTIAAPIDIAPTILNLVYPNGVFKYYLGEDLFAKKDSAILLHDLSITNGVDRVALHHYNRINGNKALFKEKLVHYIAMYEKSHKLLNIDYFSLLKDED